MIRRVLIALILSSATPAIAGWENTRWGMTEAEVRAVVPSVGPVSGKNLWSNEESNARLVGQYRFQNFEFHVALLFNRKSGGLDSVFMNLLPHQSGEALLSRLSNLHGPPRTIEWRRDIVSPSEDHIWDRGDSRIILTHVEGGDLDQQWILYYEPIPEKR